MFFSHEVMQETWLYLITLLTLMITSATAIHILLKKHDTHAATGWLGLVWFTPVLGICLYWLFGVNRIHRRAKKRYLSRDTVLLPERNASASLASVEEAVGPGDNGLVMLSRMAEKVIQQPLLRGNTIHPLVNGDQAYPCMLKAIAEAKQSISLCSYILDNDSWGRKFRAALKEAQREGAEVRVLLDGVGARYSLPPITWQLRRDNIPVACFMQTILPWRFRYLNLRNHRKVLVVDGKTGFTGGMNIQARNVLGQNPRHPVQDVHFHLEGPIVADLQRAFAEDWGFTTGEKLTGPKWFPHINEAGAGLARGIIDGPDEDYDKLRMIMLGALASARHSIQIATPYFLPDSELVSGLCVAALRGVEVQILLPSRPNLRMVKWASDAGLPELLAAGCTVYQSDPPFDHSKIMIVDHAWVLLGSANWDARSLRLNFEFNVECYDRDLSCSLQEIFDRKVGSAHHLLLSELTSRNLIITIRNKLFRLFSPYL